MLEDLERLEAAMEAKAARKGKGRGTLAGALATTAVTAAAGPVVAVRDKDVFGSFGSVDYGPMAAVAALAAGSETKTEVESNAESD
jgi:phage tail tape-measure protein